MAVPAKAEQRQIGEPIKAIGTVSLTRDGAARQIGVSEPLYAADVVQTGDRSYARLGFTSGWDIDLPAMSVADLAWAPDPDTIYVRVGAVRGVSQPDAPPLKVISGRAIAEARGTAFLFLVAPDGATSLLVEEGTVAFAARDGASVVVGAGLASTVAAAGGVPTPPAPPPAGLTAPAANLATTAALEAAPGAALPTESFARLRAMRPAVEQALQQTPASPGSERSLGPPPPLPPTLAEQATKLLTAASAALLLVPALIVDGTSSTSTSSTSSTSGTQ